MIVIEIKDKKIWDDFVEYALLQSWNWGEFNKKIGRKVFRYAVVDGKDIVALFQFFIIETKISKYLYLPNGPVFKNLKPFNKNFSSKLEEYDLYIKEIINFLVDFAKKEKIHHISIDPLFPNSLENRKYLRTNGFIKSVKEIQGGNKWLLDLTQTENEIMNKMFTTTKTSIKKAFNMNFTLLKDDLCLFEDFWNMYVLTKKRNAFDSYQKSYYFNQLEFLMSKGEYNIYILKNSYGENVAGAMISFYQKVASYLHGASNFSAKDFKFGPKFLIWQIILEAKKIGMKIFDFYGIARNPLNKKDPWYGFTHFKQGFGGYNLEMLETYDYVIFKTEYFKRRLVDLFRKYFNFKLFKNFN